MSARRFGLAWKGVLLTIALTSVVACGRDDGADLTTRPDVGLQQSGPPPSVRKAPVSTPGDGATISSRPRP